MGDWEAREQSSPGVVRVRFIETKMSLPPTKEPAAI